MGRCWRGSLWSQVEGQKYTPDGSLVVILLLYLSLFFWFVPASQQVSIHQNKSKLLLKCIQ